MPDKNRVVVGWVISALGLIVVLWGVFHLTNATIGGRVGDFAHRRTYDEVKLAAHKAYPGALLRALCGLVLIWLGGKVRVAKS